jgi:hypothetical protein
MSSREVDRLLVLVRVSEKRLTQHEAARILQHEDAFVIAIARTTPTESRRSMLQDRV